MALGFLTRFRRENSSVARREREEAIAKAITTGLRTLSGLISSIADRVESQRLRDSGYTRQNSFLERTDKK